jgi:hypothetical protein
MFLQSVWLFTLGLLTTVYTFVLQVSPLPKPIGVVPSPVSNQHEVLSAATKNKVPEVDKEGTSSGTTKPKPTKKPQSVKKTSVSSPAPTLTTESISKSTNTPSNTSNTTPNATPSTQSTSSPSQTQSATVTKTTPYWSIRSVSSMKESKDRICGPRDASYITRWVAKAKELGVNYIAVETPYDNPGCGDALAYTKSWTTAIRSAGLRVWHRHMPLAFEGIYGVPKNNSKTYIDTAINYIKNNSTLFAEGDIFTPIPEPQNGGIQGITYCSENVCQFQNAADFNAFLRNAISSAQNAFHDIGLGGKIKIGYYGFDGFVTWGDNNPDWHGILEDSTITAMGNITIDHYPQQVGDTMANDLDELQAKYPNTPIIIGEWGSVNASDLVGQVKSAMSAAQRKNVIGFNYWHMGVGGNEALINDDFSNKSQYTTVQSYFKASQ